MLCSEVVLRTSYPHAKHRRRRNAMLFVFSTCLSLSFAWLAVYVTATGFQTTVAIASTIQTTQRSEYKEHLCGSLQAAAANIEAASELLSSFDAKLSKAYTHAANTYVASLQSITVTEFLPWESMSCDDIVITTHHQSIDDTPYNLPNFIYRLNASQGSSPNE